MFFLVLAVLMYYIGYRGFKSNNQYGGSSTIICGFFFVFFGFYNIFFGFLLYPFNGFMIIWMIIVLTSNLIFAGIIYHILKKIKNGEFKLEKDKLDESKKWSLYNYILLMTQENPYHESIPLKMETIRKSFHLLGFLFLLGFFGFCFVPPLTQIANQNTILLIKDTEWMYNLLWGDIEDYPYEADDFQAVIDITLFGLLASLVFSIIPELIRILWGPEYSSFNFLTRSILRKKEYNAVGPHIYLISSIIFSYLLFTIGLVNIYVAATGITIACFSDALAALVGRNFGYHKVVCLSGEVKSVEGFFAGVGSAFLIGMIILGPVYAIIAAVIFFALDLFPTVIADNISNSLVIIFGITVFMYLFKLPIGWL
jgi:dolichol kinase